MTDHGPAALPRQTIRLADPVPRQTTEFALQADAAARAALAQDMGISGLRKLSFSGHLTPLGRHDWSLSARLGATVVQPCVVTLAPVATRIDEEVARRYMTRLPEPAPGEVEMPDDEVEPLPAALDLWTLVREALSLALPQWPRAPGAELGAAIATEPGARALDDAAARPFAGLSDLRARLGEPDDKDGRDDDDGT